MKPYYYTTWIAEHPEYGGDIIGMNLGIIEKEQKGSSDDIQRNDQTPRIMLSSRINMKIDKILRHFMLSDEIK